MVHRDINIIKFHVGDDESFIYDMKMENIEKLIMKTQVGNRKFTIYMPSLMSLKGMRPESATMSS